MVIDSSQQGFFKIIKAIMCGVYIYKHTLSGFYNQPLVITIIQDIMISSSLQFDLMELIMPILTPQ